MTAEGKVERTWNAGHNNKEKSWRETDLVPVLPFNTKPLLKCPLFYITSQNRQFIKTAHDRKHDTTNKGLKNAGSEILQKPSIEAATKLNEL